MMLDLIARLEKATEPDGSLDFAIHLALKGQRNIGGYWAEVIATGERVRTDYNCPAYTASVDAALTLMRKHYLWQLKQGIGCTAIVWWIEKDWDDTGAPTAHSTTYPALALATAALIARAVEDRVSSPLPSKE